jgi:DNA polymerase III, alpha subunit
MRSIIDPWGRALITVDDIPALLLSGQEIGDLLFQPGEAVDAFNALCRRFDQMQCALSTVEPLEHSPEEEMERRANEWLIGEEFKDIDIRELLLGCCTTDQQRQRVNEEMDLFEKRGLVPLLRCMIALVAHLRERNIVWGVGRGSSVASYVLYLIGVHRIDPLKYDLSISEFLR